MVTSLPEEEPARAPRAVAYARTNQGADRYRRRSPRGRAAGQRATGRPPRRSLNHTRFWFFTAVLLVALAVAAATLSAVSAGPAPLARPADPPVARPRPPEGARPVPLTAAPAPPEAPGGGRESTERVAARTGDDRPGSASRVGEPARPPAAGVRPTAQAGGSAPTAPPGQTRGSSVGDQGPYKNCGQARRAGVAPLYRGDPGYSARLDGDGDGVACDRKAGRP